MLLYTHIRIRSCIPGIYEATGQLINVNFSLNTIKNNYT